MMKRNIICKPHSNAIITKKINRDTHLCILEQGLLRLGVPKWRLKCHRSKHQRRSFVEAGKAFSDDGSVVCPDAAMEEVAGSRSRRAASPSLAPCEVKNMKRCVGLFFYTRTHSLTHCRAFASNEARCASILAMSSITRSSVSSGLPLAERGRGESCSSSLLPAAFPRRALSSSNDNAAN